MLEARFKSLLKKLCKRHNIDPQLIDDTLTYWENKRNIEQQTHVHLTKVKPVRKRRKKEPILNIGESLRNMGWTESWEQDLERLEQRLGGENG